MRKAEFIEVVASKSELTKQDAKKAVEALFETIYTTLAKGEEVQVGLGTFEVREHPEVKGRNPKTGIKISIPARKVPSFKAGKEFKKALNVK
ncbi:HU family DNA-binding protein (plasmid) [Priestia sp. MF3]|uniref:HU family DNA-binding protein n=1 Tax=Priestia sp. MF3 TaxID=3404779 RepID=UPI003B9F6018